MPEVVATVGLMLVWLVVYAAAIWVVDSTYGGTQ